MNTYPTVVAAGNHAARLTSSELLMRAAEVIERCGWLQGELWLGSAWKRQYHEGDPCCVTGALAVARGITDPIDAADWEYHLNRYDKLCVAVAKLRTEINRNCAAPLRYVEFWNDTVCTDRDQAVRVLDAAARVKPSEYFTTFNEKGRM
jgi:hypothetical protein